MSDEILKLIQAGIDAQNKGKIEEALNYYNRALEKAREAESPEHIAGSLFNIGRILEGKGEYDQAMESYQESNDILKEFPFLFFYRHRKPLP